MEAQLFAVGTVPEWTTPAWYAGRETAPHLEQAGHRDRLMLTAEFVSLAVAMGARDVVDLGAGDGGLLSIVAGVERWGYDLQQTNVDAAARRHVNVSLLDVVQDAVAVSWADCVVVTEMLEHLIDPHKFVRAMYESPARFLVASSPHTETATSHYEFHTWAWDCAGYQAMIEAAGWRVVRVATAWICQVVLATKP